MSLVHHHPVRPAGSSSQLVHAREELLEEFGALRKPESEEVDGHVFVRTLEDAHHLADGWWPVGRSNRHGHGEVVVVSLGIDDAELVPLVG